MVPSPSYRPHLHNRLTYPAEREGMLLPMIQIYQLHIHPVYLHIASHIPTPLSIVIVSDLPVKSHTCPELTVLPIALV